MPACNQLNNIKRQGVTQRLNSKVNSFMNKNFGAGDSRCSWHKCL